ncbi:uncharacterized protein LOC144124809 [Amblyomma americanum]
MKLVMLQKTSVNGLKGPSPLWSLKYLDLVSCYTVEYMHCVLLGVTRQFTEYWFDSSSCREKYYIGRPSTVNALNKRLTSIRPPHHVTRLPRTIQERHFWKAHEWRNWLLFYCVPCCLNTLPAQFLRHFALLCEAIFILLQEQLSSAAINYADRLLQRFVRRAAALYGERCMSFNVHQLTHLTQAARNFGPLWAHSAFGFESGNGHIVKLVTAANGVPDQILERAIMSQELHLVLSLNAIPLRSQQLCSEFLHYPNVSKAHYVQGACMFGVPKEVPLLLPAERAALELMLNNIPRVQEYFRFFYRGTVMHSQQYQRGTKSDSSVIESQDGEFFVIKRIFEVVDGGSPSNGEVVLLCRKIVCEDCDLKKSSCDGGALASSSQAGAVLRVSPADSGPRPSISMATNGPPRGPAFREPPSKAHCFNFVLKNKASVDGIVDGIEAVVGPKGLESLQHQGCFKLSIA